MTSKETGNKETGTKVTGNKLTVRQVAGVAAIAAEVWDALANPPHLPRDPFLSHEFFLALEESGSATAYSGWRPFHLMAEDQGGAIVGILPLYAKSHSQGEYVFDHGWARGLTMAGGRYYPKLLTAVPFTPVTGRRLLLGEAAASFSPTQEAIAEALLKGAQSITRENGLSSYHLNFVEPGLLPLLEGAGFLLRQDTQFHFEDAGYGDFEGFLSTLQSRKRKSIRRERRQALEGTLESGLDGRLEVDWIEGDQIKPAHWEAFFEFYLDTGERKWGQPYLNKKFFEQIGETMADDILLIMAREGERYIAGALNLKGGDTLYGRYWGAVETRPFLHFEICYYQAIDYALSHGLKRVEAGAQGEHKLLRGYEPMATHSAHYIAHEGLREAVMDFLEDEQLYVELQGEAMRGFLPFKKSDD